MRLLLLCVAALALFAGTSTARRLSGEPTASNWAAIRQCQKQLDCRDKAYAPLCGYIPAIGTRAWPNRCTYACANMILGGGEITKYDICLPEPTCEATFLATGDFVTADCLACPTGKHGNTPDIWESPDTGADPFFDKPGERADEQGDNPFADKP